MSFFIKTLVIFLSIGSKCYSRASLHSEESQIHTIAVKPPKSFAQSQRSDSDHNSIRYASAFNRDALRDKMIFGLDDTEPRDRSEKPKYKVINRVPNMKNARSKKVNIWKRPEYKSFKRTLDYYPKLNVAKRPKYKSLERSDTFREEMSSNFIDTSRFDKENDQVKLKMKKPKKKIVIRKFVKNAPPKTVERTPKSSKLLELLKSSKLTPAEFLYLTQKAKLEKKKRKLRARSISDSVEEESHRRSFISDNSLHSNREVKIGSYVPVEYEENQKMQFQIHGQEGPESYRFGHDTGLGYNRQFRYEERDDYGVVRGRYGYYDQHGQLRIVNYTADPVSGYHTDIDPVDSHNTPVG